MKPRPSLSEAELELVSAAAAPLPPEARTAFLVALASELASLPAAERDVERVIAELQAECWSAEPRQGYKVL